MKYIRITKPVGFQIFEPIFIVDKTQVNCFKTHGDKGRYVSDTLETEENLEKWLKYNKTSILKQANTIEELCDEFVVVSYGTNKVMYQTKDYNYFDNLGKEDFRNHPTINNKYYGAIWTDKGLIYVATMNKKGKLELC